MRQNPARRTALLDAAIDVLAEEGSRGMTFRAIDTKAGVPNGTTSNYFSNRDDLIGQVTDRTRERLTPPEADIAEILRAEPTTGLVVQLMRELDGRMHADRSSYLAMLELRLEATRRPELRATLTETFSATLAENIRFHLDAGFPGDRETVLVLYLAMTGLLLEEITVPGLLAPFPKDELIDTVVRRVLPAENTKD